MQYINLINLEKQIPFQRLTFLPNKNFCCDAGENENVTASSYGARWV